MKFQVLAAAMHQTDLSLAEKMHTCCSTVIANQADREEIVRQDTVYGEVKMVTTATRGVGLNRNIALAAADADIVLFADDDMVYCDGMAEEVVNIFEEMPEADVIIFGIDILKDGKMTEQRRCGLRRLHTWNAMRYGTVRVAARRQSLIRKNITFHQCFGGGCPFSAGEDSLLLKACFDAGLKVYSHPYVLGSCCKDTSTWFVGYNEKYFYDKGVLVRHLFPRSAYIMALYFGLYFKRETDLGPMERLRYVYAGIRGGKKMIPYQSRT